MMATDLKTKDDLRREIRLLARVQKEFAQLLKENAETNVTYSLIVERIEDIQKALED